MPAKSASLSTSTLSIKHGTFPVSIIQYSVLLSYCTRRQLLVLPSVPDLPYVFSGAVPLALEGDTGVGDLAEGDLSVGGCVTSTICEATSLAFAATDSATCVMVSTASTNVEWSPSIVPVADGFLSAVSDCECCGWESVCEWVSLDVYVNGQSNHGSIVYV